MLKVPTTEVEVVAKLAKHYAPPSWALLTQVRNGTGFQRAPRTMDALAMALWPSRGLELLGMEIKVSRADWWRELRDPRKAEDFYGYVDRWYLVTPPDVVQPGELPATWGHIVVTAKGVSYAKEAPRAKKPKPVDRLFLAAILRRVQDSSIPRDQVKGEIAAAYTRGKDEGTSDGGYKKDEHQRLQEAIKAFEQASGVRLDAWDDTAAIGRAVALVRDKGVEHFRKVIKDQVSFFERVIAEAKEYLTELDPKEPT